MRTYRQLWHVENGRVLLKRLKWCDSFGSKLRGFTFRRSLSLDDGLVLVEKSDNRFNTAIHMLFVFFDLGVIWINEAGEVVDAVVAKPWRPSYVPQAPACYVIELHPSLLGQVQVGDHLQFLDEEV
ncbi:MAG: DUF192 domain-containing protein [Anaerolineales bacterium]|nr:DUF192 domain-containing protein [Anaerolineales bacterium]